MGKFNNFFDVGANIGLYGFMFLCHVKNSRVIFVEADPSNSFLLKKTI